ncbi:uncharacterized protein GGS22DRAFT_196400 [Annulohypoxylon maeteangense]|uniref:uncharacterized protein n=1 Tax=Annulohypoxylon maeteangense TaxID=1927788 RepID=UPI0020079F8D|nr:uncharacterized protein GGS22DRAFT_196400 [Annulohypoxylon maeteangense]KAI0881435.1 hypothetical protein GGS22DRAFT_196400 [Annulohypoxylon maeteangense]
MAQNTQQGTGKAVPDFRPMQPAPARNHLDPYVRLAVPGQMTKPIRPPTENTTLRKGRTNRILLYHGCFNPPHHGHMGHLRHALRYCGQEINVIGAFIIVLPNGMLDLKLGVNSKEIKLDIKKRVALWDEELRAQAQAQAGNRDEGWVERCWVMMRSEWSQAEPQLEQDFARDGFDVEFVTLAGGDKFSEYSTHVGWGYPMTMTTNISRPVFFYKSTSNSPLPKTLRDHTPWELMPSNPHSPRRVVFTCRYIGLYKTYTLRFVSALFSEQLDPTLSSTKVRSIINTTQVLTRNSSDQEKVTRLATRLGGVVLSPNLLAQYIVEEWKKRGNDAPQFLELRAIASRYKY